MGVLYNLVEVYKRNFSLTAAESHLMYVMLFNISDDGSIHFGDKTIRKKILEESGITYGSARIIRSKLTDKNFFVSDGSRGFVPNPMYFGSGNVNNIKKFIIQYSGEGGKLNFAVKITHKEEVKNGTEYLA